MTPIPFTLSEDIFVEAARAHNKTKWPRFIAVYVTVSALFGFVLPGFVDGWSFDHRFWADSLSMAALMIAVAGSMSALMFALTWFRTIPGRVRRGLLHFDATSLSQWVAWDETNLMQSSDEGHSSVRFARLAGWKRVGGHLLIYRTDDYYNIIPASALAHDPLRQALIDRLTAASVKERV